MASAEGAADEAAFGAEVEAEVANPLLGGRVFDAVALAVDLNVALLAADDEVIGVDAFVAYLAHLLGLEELASGAGEVNGFGLT